MKSVDAKGLRPDGERRVEDRVVTGFTVEIRGPREDGETFSGTVLNLSHAGLALRLDRRMELHVPWAGETESTRGVDVRFGLPLRSTLVPVEARCRVAWSKDVGDGRSCLGLEVLEFHGNSRQELEQFLAARAP